MNENFNVKFEDLVVVEAGASTFDKLLSGQPLGDITSNVETVAADVMEYDETITSISLPKAKTIGSRAFVVCPKLQSINIPVVETIGDSAFRAVPVTSITIPTTIQTIGNLVFSDCSKLTTAYILGKPTSIATDAFNRCAYLNDIYVVWAEGEVADAPWGATNATVHYNYMPEE